MKVVCVGDSITFAEHLDRSLAWTSVLQRLRPEHEIVNRGVCGDTTRLGLERFPADVQELLPDVVVIQFGWNDCNRWQTDMGLPRVSPDAFEANLREMVERSQRFGALQVILCGLTPHARGFEWEVPRTRYTNLISKVAWEHHPYSRFYDPCEHLEGHDSILLDHIHLNEAGNRVFAHGLDSRIEWPVAVAA